MTDNTTCDLSLNVAVSTVVTLCETIDMATCSKGKSNCNCNHYFYPVITTILVCTYIGYVHITCIRYAHNYIELFMGPFLFIITYLLRY